MKALPAGLGVPREGAGLVRAPAAGAARPRLLFDLVTGREDQAVNDSQPPSRLVRRMMVKTGLQPGGKGRQEVIKPIRIDGFGPMVFVKKMEIDRLPAQNLVRAAPSSLVFNSWRKKAFLWFSANSLEFMYPFGLVKFLPFEFRRDLLRLFVPE